MRPSRISASTLLKVYFESFTRRIDQDWRSFPPGAPSLSVGKSLPVIGYLWSHAFKTRNPLTWEELYADQKNLAELAQVCCVAWPISTTRVRWRENTEHLILWTIWYHMISMNQLIIIWYHIVHTIRCSDEPYDVMSCDNISYGTLFFSIASSLAVLIQRDIIYTILLS